jgi:hypothetical protein
LCLIRRERGSESEKTIEIVRERDGERKIVGVCKKAKNIAYHGSV